MEHKLISIMLPISHQLVVAWTQRWYRKSTLASYGLRRIIHGRDSILEVEKRRCWLVVWCGVWSLLYQSMDESIDRPIQPAIGRST